jgi:hypothetical protein
MAGEGTLSVPGIRVPGYPRGGIPVGLTAGTPAGDPTTATPAMSSTLRGRVTTLAPIPAAGAATGARPDRGQVDKDPGARG